MADKEKTTPGSPGKAGAQNYTQPEGFTHGMVSDVDPRFQLKGSYSDAQNIRLTNSEGSTFTAENIEGNSLFVDLATYPIHSEAHSGGSETTNYPTFFDRGPNAPYAAAPVNESYSVSNLHLGNRASIVGHTSFSSQLILIIVARFEWVQNYDFNAPEKDEVDRTIFLKVDFDSNFAVTKVTDLRVCYNTEGYNYPNLNMELDVPVRVESIIENENTVRIYWTDNKNPLRTLNIGQQDKLNLSIDSLDISPLMSPSQPTLNKTLHGSLPVGNYQYTYKYISENGGETTFSPLSNLYHVSDQAFGSTLTFGGGPRGNLGSQGFTINVADIDQDFTYVELYSLFYESLNNPPRVAVVAKRRISGLTMQIDHVNWNNEIPQGLEQVLIEQNTWDVCKDIAIKDNILFAANLRQKKNWISEKEWNVKVLRWCISSNNNRTSLAAMLTTDDRDVKHYTTNSSGNSIEVKSGNEDTGGHGIDEMGFHCGYGQRLHQNHTSARPNRWPNGSYSWIQETGISDNPMWTTIIENVRRGDTANYATTKTAMEYRFLPDRMTLGAESFNYATNNLGGCRVSFGVQERAADAAGNVASSPYVSATTTGEDFKTDNVGGQLGIAQADYYNNSETTFKTSMSLGGSYDPHAAGDKRGYQRGEVYRFGVQIYDLNGTPGNVLWIGDIQMPEQHDVLRMIDTTAVGDTDRLTSSGEDYYPFKPTISGTASTITELLKKSNSSTLFTSHPLVKDFRLSYLYGHSTPSVDVEWFTGRLNDSPGMMNSFPESPYVTHKGKIQDNLPGTNTNFTTNGRRKSLTSPNMTPYLDLEYNNFDNTQYVFDLFVNFEFIIPRGVCDKISGFRVVRAERKEKDRRILQQGLLNQTAQYGRADKSLEFGYGETNLSREDNNGFDNDPVFVNQYNDPTLTPSSSVIDPTITEQPEYNTYLNGYLGLAENSHYVYHKDSSSGKATLGGNTAGDLYYWQEMMDQKRYNKNTNGTPFINSVPMQWSNSVGKYMAGGHLGNLNRKSAYFGSYDKRMVRNQAEGGTAGAFSNREAQRAAHISGSVYTIDSPDSAFGIRPYQYKEGDRIRIDCVLKLSNQDRYDTHSSVNIINSTGNQGTPYGNYTDNWPWAFWSHGTKFSGQDVSTMSGADIAHKSNSSSLTEQEGLKYASKRNVEDHYSVLVGKYYCWDPYFGIGMELDGGLHAAEDSKKANHNGGAYYSPERRHGWSLPLSNAKEIVDGEIVPSGFFKISERMKDGRVHGFSNNTLGYAKFFNGGSKQGLDADFKHFVFDAAHKYLSKLDGKKPSGGLSGWTDSKQTKDYNYDTISTMQMGLRSILIEVNTDVGKVRPRFYDRDNTARPRFYSEWFACPNLSTIYEQGHWFGVDANTGSTSSSVRNPYVFPPVSSSAISAFTEATNETNRIQKNGLHIGYVNQDGKNIHPHKYLCSIVRRTIPYGGWSKAALEATRYIPCGNFHPIKKTNLDIITNTGSPKKDGRQGHLSKVFGGDTFVSFYSHQKTSAPYMKNSAARWQVFPVESYVNTDMRSGLALTNGDVEIGKKLNAAPYSNDWLYNSVYSQESNTKGSLMIDESLPENYDLPYEIAYSNTKVLGQTGDAFRQFPINQFHDMEGLYGEINRIVNFKNEIYVLQDNAFSKLLVNPLSMLSDDSGNSLFTGTGETVENHIYISTKYGTRHKFSVTQSETSLYFVDSTFARLFKYDAEKLISLGDSLGQRNYLEYIIKDWENKKVKTNSSTPDSLKGNLNSTKKRKRFEEVTRDYFSDNSLKFLGIYSVYDFQKKELLVTFHNSAWGNENTHRQLFADPLTNSGKGSTTNGQPVGVSETLVYSEAINSFISKYTVAPPQWISGNGGAFLLCPENEIGVHSIANFSPYNGFAATYTHKPYNNHGSVDSNYYKQYRVNPLRLWLWNRHDEKLKTNFFGKNKDVKAVIHGGVTTYPALVGYGHDTETPIAVKTFIKGEKPLADKAYIEKVINNDAGNSKVFDNARIIMTPKSVEHSNVQFYTDVVVPQNLVINKRWDFNDTQDGWRWNDGTTTLTSQIYNTGESTISLNAAGAGSNLNSPNMENTIDLIGSKNYIVRARIKRTSGAGWGGALRWAGSKLTNYQLPLTNWSYVGTDSAHQATASLPEDIDNDYVIVQWDMRTANNSSGTIKYVEHLIKQIQLRLTSSPTTNFKIDWIEIGGFSNFKYDDGILKFPLRTEESVRRTRGTWSKIKYSAQTTDKFNIFAILAKYRELYKK